ncbi:ECF transporter S component, partial [Pseudobutyrivibrio sp.]|uniref:ECF transporter S component n=1 Tax=Pseudobutyrivibrio sp. TaxID=2014367 RepID=UPI001B53451E
MQSNNSKTYELVLTALFVAIIVVMASTPLGFIPLVVINATTLHIPVIIGSLFLGPKKGGFLGGVFGLTSLIKSSLGAASLSAFVFSPVAAVSMLPHDTVGAAVLLVLKSTFIAVVPRILIGVVPYFVYVGIKKAIGS